MQRVIVHGVPYLVDAQQRVFLYDTSQPSLHIGTFEPESNRVRFLQEVKPQIEARATAWRDEQQPRSRKPTATHESGDDGETDEDD